MLCADPFGFAGAAPHSCVKAYADNLLRPIEDVALCSVAGRDTSMYIVVHLIREARRLMHNLRNVLVFLFGMCRRPYAFPWVWPAAFAERR